MPQQLDFHTAILLILIRKAIWNEDIHSGMFGEAHLFKEGKPIECSEDIWQHVEEKDWEIIMKLSGRHAVRAIAFDGVCAFGVELPRKIKIQWALYVQSSEQRYEKHVKTATDLAELFDTAGIRMVLMKGIALSLDYPIPNHRECGDIDIYLDQYEKGNELIREKGISVNVHYEKHSSFFWDNIDIENHQFFLNKQVFKVDKVFDKHLSQVINNHPFGHFPNSKIMLPSADFNALFLMRHQITHVLLGLSLRHLLDYSIFLQKHHQEIDFDKLQQILRAQHLDKIVLGMNEISRQYLGLKENYFSVLGTPEEGVCQKVYDYLFHPTIKKKKYPENAWGTFKMKFDQVIVDVSSDSKLLHNENPIGLFMRILFRQLGRPTEIFKK